MYDFVIRNTSIIDGTGHPGFQGHVGVKEGKIIDVWRGSYDGVSAKEVIEGSGLVLCPGIIDVHGHTDIFYSDKNKLAKNLLLQGITSQLVGQCGFSMYGFSKDEPNQDAQKLRAAVASAAATRGLTQEYVDWNSLSEWRDRIHGSGVGVNLIPCIGHNTIRLNVMKEGADTRIQPTNDEINKMKDLIQEAMEQGAFGMTTGLRYPFGQNATTDEVVELCKVVSKFGGFHISHMRSEEEYLIPSVQELIDISRRSELPSCASHHKSMFWENWGAPFHTTNMFEDARKQGIDVLFDLYPWSYARETNMGSWFYGLALNITEENEDSFSLLEALKNEEVWNKVKAGLIEVINNKNKEQQRRKSELGKLGVYVPNQWNLSTFDCIVSSPSHDELIGLNFNQAAQKLGEQDYLDLMRKVYLDDQGFTLVAAGPINENDVRHLLSHPLAMVSTDSWVLDHEQPLNDPRTVVHPRDYGTYPRVLGYYVRDCELLSLPEAISKMTSLPAAFLNLRDRGLIKPGFWADLLLFNPDTIESNTTYSNPCQHPSGIEYVFVNGKKAVEAGKLTGLLSGKCLSR